jgi:hypothetical protein
LEIIFIPVNYPFENSKPFPMRRNSTSSLGALHPVLFFFVVYGISLFLALFVCRTVYYSINDEASVQSKSVDKPVLDYSVSSRNVAALK